jgi:phage tail-like protein
MASSTIDRFNSSLATDPLRSFRFLAEFTSVGEGGAFDDRIKSTSSTSLPVSGQSVGWLGGFTSIGGLSINTQAIQYREGGYNTTVHQIPGMTTFTPVTFSRGVLYGNDQALTWMRGLFAASAGEGLPTTTAGKSFRCNIVIKVMDHPNASTTNDVPKLAVKIHNAWISNLNYTDLDATNGAILFETMQLVHEGLSVYYTGSDGKPVDGISR